MKTKKPPISESQVADPSPSISDRVAAAGIAPVSMEEFNAEVKAARAGRSKIASVTTLDHLKTEAEKGHRKDFDGFLAMVPTTSACPTLKQLLLSDVGRVVRLTPRSKSWLL